MLLKYLDFKNTIPPSQLFELSFNDIQSKPIEILKDVYEKLDLGVFPIKELDLFLKENKSYRVNQYTISAKLEERIRNEWAFSFKAWPND